MRLGEHPAHAIFDRRNPALVTLGLREALLFALSAERRLPCHLKAPNYHIHGFLRRALHQCALLWKFYWVAFQVLRPACSSMRCLLQSDADCLNQKMFLTRFPAVLYGVLLA